MKLFQILKIIHGNEIDKIIKLLNAAIFIDKYPVKEKTAIHTGFTFCIHTGSNFELLYNYFDEVLIIQPSDYLKLPDLLGLITYSVRGKYFDTYSTTKIIDKIVSDNSYISELETTEQAVEKSAFTHLFEILDITEAIISSFPIKIKYDEALFNGRNAYKRWVKDEDYWSD